MANIKINFFFDTTNISVLAIIKSIIPVDRFESATINVGTYAVIIILNRFSLLSKLPFISDNTLGT